MDVGFAVHEGKQWFDFWRWRSFKHTYNSLSAHDLLGSLKPHVTWSQMNVLLT